MKRVRIVAPLLKPDQLQTLAQCELCNATFPRESINWKRKIRVLLDMDDDPDYFYYACYCPCSTCGSLGICDRQIFKRRKDQ